MADFDLPLGFTDPEALNRSRELNRGKLTEIQGLLSPNEYEQYLAHSSPAATYVLANLPEAKTEDEFRRMVKVAAEFEMDQSPAGSRSARYSIRDAEDDDLAKAQAQKQQAFERRLAQELGEDRLAAQKQEESAQQAAEQEEQARQGSIKQFTEVGASLQEANTLYDRLRVLQPSIEQRQKETLKPDATSQQRQAFEDEVKAEFERIAAEVLGPDKARAWVRKMH